MDHRAAIDDHAAERYLMGELEEPAREAFEEHFFSCSQCADDVRTASRLVANAREVWRAEPVKEERSGFLTAWMDRRRWAWIPAGALAASLSIAVLLPKVGHSPALEIQLLPAAVAIPSGARGGDTATAPVRAITVARQADKIRLVLDVGDTIAASVLRWSIRTADGKVLTITSPRQPQVELLLPASGFQTDGRYEVLLSADTSAAPVLDRYPFTIQHQ